jgi:hypothetical protein
MSKFDELYTYLMEYMTIGGSGIMTNYGNVDAGATGGSFGNVDSWNTGSSILAKPLGKIQKRNLKIKKSRKNKK